MLVSSPPAYDELHAHAVAQPPPPPPHLEVSQQSSFISQHSSSVHSASATQFQQNNSSNNSQKVPYVRKFKPYRPGTNQPQASNNPNPDNRQQQAQPSTEFLNARQTIGGAEHPSVPAGWFTPQPLPKNIQPITTSQPNRVLNPTMRCASDSRIYKDQHHDNQTTPAAQAPLPGGIYPAKSTIAVNLQQYNYPVAGFPLRSKTGTLLNVNIE